MRKTNLLSLTAIATLAACTTIADFNTWAPEEVTAARSLAVIAPSETYSDAVRLEAMYCEQVTRLNSTINCTPLTEGMPAGQDITEKRILTAVQQSDASHLVNISLLNRTQRQSNSATLIGDFVWGHPFTHDENVHQVQVMDIQSEELVYSAQLESHSGAALTRSGYLRDFTGNIVRDQRRHGLLQAP